MMIDRREFEAISITDTSDVNTLETKNLDKPYRAALLDLARNCSRWNTTEP
jgi:hypothetical protein